MSEVRGYPDTPRQGHPTERTTIMSRSPAEERAARRKEFALLLEKVHDLNNDLAAISREIDDVLDRFVEVGKSLETPDAELIGGADDEPTTAVLRQAGDAVRDVAARERAGERIGDETTGFRVRGD
jgi:hypothetical protein